MGCSTPEPADTSRAGPCLALLSACALAGCAAVGYYAQSVTGHLGLMYRAQPIETVIAAPDTEPGLAARLRTALDIREFASDALALPANASYRRYVELDRRFVVWNVVATPELSLAPRQWCFPVAGCLSYRGYFSESAAETYAEALEARGWDVTVAGVRAYSTLGWFADPLLSSMVELPEYLLAGLVFHELAHQRLYAPDDTEFNESFAVVVERAGVDRWIEAAGRAGLAERYRTATGRRAAFLALVRGARRDLEAVYASSRSDTERRAVKAKRIERLRARYAALRAGWKDGPVYDAWFERGVNNAAIALVSTYDRWVPALEVLLARCGGDLRAFYRASDALAKLTPAERRAKLEKLGHAARRNQPVVSTPSPMQGARLWEASGTESDRRGDGTKEGAGPRPQHRPRRLDPQMGTHRPERGGAGHKTLRRPSAQNPQRRVHPLHPTPDPTHRLHPAVPAGDPAPWRMDTLGGAVARYPAPTSGCSGQRRDSPRATPGGSRSPRW